jgi:hypothetical protein
VAVDERLCGQASTRVDFRAAVRAYMRNNLDDPSTVDRDVNESTVLPELRAANDEIKTHVRVPPRPSRFSGNLARFWRRPRLSFHVL